MQVEVTLLAAKELLAVLNLLLALVADKVAMHVVMLVVKELADQSLRLVNATEEARVPLLLLQVVASRALSLVQ